MSEHIHDQGSGASASVQASANHQYLPALGVYGFGEHEPVILAALVTGDPLLLIGKSGTGKTFLLNSISEALSLEHRHYNASLISFDDLVGFPFPDEGRHAVHYLQTPATVWGAESVLVDEISRCKPEHQNRLFSLIHERKLQGLSLERLRYRWAAMNPASTDQSSGDDYLGAEPLDAALADRFAVVLDVGDWDALSDDERRAVANPTTEGQRSDDGGALRGALERWREEYAAQTAAFPSAVIDYACAATTALRGAQVRISPRRARLLCRTLMGAAVTQGLTGDRLKTPPTDALFHRVLAASVPQRATGQSPADAVIQAAHRFAWDGTMTTGAEQWLHQFHLADALDRKVALLLDSCPDSDTGTIAVTQFLANATQEDRAVFAFATYPAALAGRLPVGAEGLNDLGRVAQSILSVDATIQWTESESSASGPHPHLAAYQEVVNALSGARRERADQLFAYCVTANVSVSAPRQLEQVLERCVRKCAPRGKQ